MIRPGIAFLARLISVVAALVVLTSCGSGAIGTPPVNDPTRIVLMPENATLYSGLPTTFTVTGGTGAYIVSSNNQAVIPVSGLQVTSSFTVIPSPVTTDTTLTLTARDTGTALPVTVNLTVKPGTVSNNITITPSTSDCSPAICSGGDAVVSTVISQGGIPLAARGVRFDVVSGDYRFITSPAGAPETTALSILTATDETGTARVRIRASNTAANQTAILQVTDVASGAYQRTTLFIAQASATVAGFFIVPDTLTFTGDRADRCAIGNISGQVFVFGGSPPYTVSNTSSSAFSISPTVLTASGQSFNVTPTGVCVPELAVPVRDASGRTVTLTLKNQVGTEPVPTPAALTVAPTSVTLSSCTDVATVFVVGGNGTYNAGSTRSFVMANASGGSASGGSVSIRRVAGTDALGATSATVAVSDGTSIVSVGVTLAGAATGLCP